MSSLDQAANFVKVNVSLGYSSTDTVIELATGQGSKLPDPADGEYNLVWYNASDYVDPADDPNVEIVRATALDGDELTILRAQEGTNATQKQNANKIYRMQLSVTAKMINDISSLIGVAGSLQIIAVTGTTPGTDFTAAKAHTGNSIIINSNTTFFEGTDYVCDGTDVAWQYSLPGQYSGTMTLIAVG